MSDSAQVRTRYRFAGFTASPARRQLLRDGVEIPLIPRYFDLLLLLLRRREVAVTRREIMESVWSDVIVSDGALSQAVRTLRRTLGDDSRTPVFIRTVSRHGYRFTYPDVLEEPDRDSPAPTPPVPVLPPVAEPAVAAVAADPREDALTRLLATDAPEEDRREAAETLVALGTEETLRRLDERPGHEAALALLRDARWSVPGAGRVPLAGRPGGARAARILIGMRLRLAARHASGRWAAAALGGALAGAVAGGIGGVALRLIPQSVVPATIPVVFALVGAAIGFLGAGGVGAGFAVAEALARSFRGTALVAFGSLGGGAIGALTHLLAGWVLSDLFGREIAALGGGIDGLAIGAAAGLGYAISTPRPFGGGMATPRGRSRWVAALVTGAACAVAGMLLAASGRTLGGGSLDLLARSFQGSRAGLAAVGALVGEDGLGPASRLMLGAWEGSFFGCGLVLGITHRPRIDEPRNA